jgi:hypothetical protein
MPGAHLSDTAVGSMQVARPKVPSIAINTKTLDVDAFKAIDILLNPSATQRQPTPP